MPKASNTKAAPKTKAVSKATYVVRRNGAVIGSTTSRSVRYTHALVGQLQEATVRKWAYSELGDEDDMEEGSAGRYRNLFDHYTKETKKDFETEQVNDRRLFRRINPCG